MKEIQRERADWWNAVSDIDRKAINEGLEQLERGEFLTRTQVQKKIKEKYKTLCDY